MYSKGTKKGTTKFQLNARKETKQVSLAGDFNKWQPQAMKRQKDGAFAVTVTIAPGRYEYKFLVDGDWVHDTDTPSAVMNRFGTYNSVLVVE